MYVILTDCVRAKRNVRRLERFYHRTSSTSDRKKWVEAIRAMHALFSAKERSFWEKRIELAAGDGKKCWRAMNKFMCKKSNGKIPDGLTAEAFSRFFAQKVETVRAATAAADPPVFTSCPRPCSFKSFKPLSQDQILFFIRRCSFSNSVCKQTLNPSFQTCISQLYGSTTVVMAIYGLH